MDNRRKNKGWLLGCCWDPEIHMLFVKLPDISLNIFFEMTFSKKWLSWKKVKFLNIASCHQLLSENHNPPIRDLQKFMEELIMNFPVPPAPSSIQTEANLWILNERKRI